MRKFILAVTALILLTAAVWADGPVGGGGPCPGGQQKTSCGPHGLTCCP